MSSGNMSSPTDAATTNRNTAAGKILRDTRILKPKKCVRCVYMTPSLIATSTAL